MIALLLVGVVVLLAAWERQRLLAEHRAQVDALLNRIQAPGRVIERELAPAGPDLPSVQFENDGQYWQHVEETRA